MAKTPESNLSFLDQFEIGGNFFEMIEFSLERHLPSGRTVKGLYGINVAKVREVVHMPEINPLASKVAGIEGIFELRGVPIPAVNLRQVLGDVYAPVTRDQQIIVAEFSQKRAGFIVSATHRIRRIAWDKVLSPTGDQSSFMTGMVLLQDHQFLFILDLEKIISDLEVAGSGGVIPSASDSYMAPSVSSHYSGEGRGVLVVDDSRLILNNVSKSLSKVGYRVLVAEDGEKALGMLEDVAAGRNKRFGSISAVVTDVEMPRMNGLTLITKVREHPSLSSLPIILHTSLSGDATKSAASKCGANGFVVKNDINSILELLAELMQQNVAIGA